MLSHFNVFNEVKAIEEAIKQRRSILEDTIQGELERINKECYLNNYEARHDTTMKDIISTIVGINGVDRKMGRLLKLRKKLLEELETTKTFSFAKSKN